MPLPLPLKKLYHHLNYTFVDSQLLREALTHRSVKNHPAGHNERLEFLGDAILGFIIAEQLYHQFPDLDEGQLSRLRASLVKKETLADIAKSMQLSDFLILGSGELKSGGFNRASILADATEAIFGAVFLDKDIHASQQVILHLYQDKLKNLTLIEKDPKTRLQEYLQARKLAIPEYIVTKITGKPHQQQFQVHCQVDALDFVTIGSSSSRRKAEQITAKLALAKIKAMDAKANE